MRPIRTADFAWGNMHTMSTKTEADRIFNPVFDFIESLVDAGRLPSAVVAITSHNEVHGLRAYGAWPDGSPVSTDDIFLLFSVSKPFTAIAVAQLWERGNIHLHEPVMKYIPEFGENGKESISIWHLLTHTSGMNQKAFERILIEKPPPDIEILDAIRAAAVDIPCGRKKVYNSLTFSVLGELIRRLTGRDYDEYMRENIFAPLHMGDTSFYREGMDKKRVIPIVNPVELNVEHLVRGKYPAGSIFSTASDLISFGQTLLNGGARDGYTMLSPLTIANMTTPHSIGTDPFVNFDFNGMETGLGWLIPVWSRSLIYREMYGHHGAGKSMLWVYPKDDLALVFLSNDTGPSMFGQLDTICNVFSSCIGYRARIDQSAKL